MKTDEPENQVELTSLDAVSPLADQAAGAPHAEKASSQHYSLLHTVGQGAMGAVYLAKDDNLLRKVAYKRIHAGLFKNRQVLGRFLSEAQITAQLDHPSVVPIYSLEVLADGQIAYAMKLIQGKTLKDLLKAVRGNYDRQQVLPVSHQLTTLLAHFLKVCDAMTLAHSRGVIHRDLKPANIMLGSYQEVYVVDWGIARLMASHEESLDPEVVQLIQPDQNEPPIERTQLGQILGTPRYMSPEQAKGQNDQLDGRSDQFALGLILFELVTLKPALVGKTPIELITRLLKDQKEPMIHYAAGVAVPKDLQAIVARATALQREDRYADVGQLAEDVRRYLRGEAVVARPDSPLRQGGRWLKQHLPITLGLVMGLLSLSALTMGVSLSHQRSQLLALQAREKQLGAYLANVSRHSHQFDSQLMRFQGLVGGLAAAATELLVRGRADSENGYLSQEFQSSPPVPADLAAAPHYAVPISTDWPAFQLTGSLAPAIAQLLRQRLIPLRYELQKMMLRSSDLSETEPLPLSSSRSLIASGSTAFHTALVRLPGLTLSYPGSAQPLYQQAQADAWYQQAQQQHSELRWQLPYFDPQRQAFFLPCSKALYDDQQHFLGLAAAELSLSYLQQFLLESPQLPRQLQIYLVNAQGQIIGQHENGRRSSAARPLASLATFPQPQVLQAILQQRSGYHETEQEIIAYHRLSSLDWYYVTAIEKSRLLSQEAP